MAFSVCGAAGPSSLSPGLGGLPVAAQRIERDPEKTAQLTLEGGPPAPPVSGVSVRGVPNPWRDAASFALSLPEDVALFNEYHALIVRLGKEFCKKSKPLCPKCPLGEYDGFIYQMDTWTF